jgi:hypothetical protein
MAYGDSTQDTRSVSDLNELPKEEHQHRSTAFLSRRDQINLTKLHTGVLGEFSIYKKSDFSIQDIIIYHHISRRSHCVSLCIIVK